MSKTKVISVSAVSGGGKTSVVNELIAMSGKSVAVFFDSYNGDLLGRDYCEWSEAGADANEWNLDALIQDIKMHINNEYEYVFVDYPFGRAHSGASALIDLAVFIDTPLDVALARRISRDYCRRDPSRRPINEPIEHLSESIDFYLQRHRVTYLKHIGTVKPTCDITVSGLATPHDIALEIMNRINN